MRKLFVVLIVLGAVWTLGEVAITALASSEIERRVAARTEGEATVSAGISSFPVVTRAIVTGRINRLSLHLESVEQNGITFADVRFDVTGIVIDRDSVLRRTVRVTDIVEGSVTATIDATALPPGALRVLDVAASSVRVDGRRLLVGPVTVVLSSQLFPCAPEPRVAGQTIVLACTFTEVPQPLIEVAQR